MKFDLCLCVQIPTINLPTKLIVVVTKRESRVPTNTGRLATLALVNSATLVRGDCDRPYDLTEHLPRDHQHWLLYPAEDAEVLTHDLVAKATKPITLVVPDGNWRQANKMRRRDPGMETLRTVKLAVGNPSEYRVRRESQAEGLATIEAIARALGVIEGREVQMQLEQLFRSMVSRTLASRGVVVAHQNVIKQFESHPVGPFD